MRYDNPVQPLSDGFQFETSRLSRAMRLSLFLFCVAPVVAVLLMDDRGVVAIIVGVVFGLMALLFAGPWAATAGRTVRVNPDGEFAGLLPPAPATTEAKRNVPPVKPDAIFFHAPEPPERTRLQVARVEASVPFLAARLDAALDQPPTPHALAELLDDVARVARSAESTPLGTLEGNVVDAFPVALAYDLASTTGVPLLWRSKRDDTARIVTPRMASLPLVDRLGRSEPWPDDAGAVPRLVRSWRSSDTFLGAILSAISWFGVGVLADVEAMHVGGVLIVVCGALISLGRIRLVLADGQLRVGRWRSERIALDRVVDIVPVPGRSELIFVTLAPTPHLVVPDARADDTGSAGLGKAVRAAYVAWAREVHARGERRQVLSAPPERAVGPVGAPSFLPAAAAPLAAGQQKVLSERAPRLVVEEATLHLETRSAEVSQIRLDRPFRALLSRSRDQAGQPLLHLELRQQRGTWTRLTLSSRAEQLQRDALEQLPEQGMRGDFVPPQVMQEVLAVVRGAMLANDGQERWT